MIINNQNLPYNLRISQNEPIIEIKETGETVNLLRLTASGARALANHLYIWAQSDDTPDQSAPSNIASDGPNLADQIAAWEATIASLQSENASLKERLSATVSSTEPEPNPEEISSSPAKDEELI